jgi:hypothetical protein
MMQQPLVVQGLLIIEASWSHSDTPISVGLLWTSDQPDIRDLYLKTHNTHKRDSHASGGIRNHNPSKRTAADTSLRSYGHWNRLWRKRSSCIFQKISHFTLYSQQSPRTIKWKWSQLIRREIHCARRYRWPITNSFEPDGQIACHSSVPRPLRARHANSANSRNHYLWERGGGGQLGLPYPLGWAGDIPGIRHIHSFISIQPLGRFSRNQNPVRRPVWR